MLAALPLLFALSAEAAPEKPTTCGPDRTWATVAYAGLAAEAVGLGTLTVALAVAPAPELGITGATLSGLGFGAAVTSGVGLALTAKSSTCALGRPGGLGSFGTFAVAGGLPMAYVGGLFMVPALASDDGGVYTALGYVIGGGLLVGGAALTGVGVWALVRHAHALEQVAVIPDPANRGVRIVGRF